VKDQFDIWSFNFAGKGGIHPCVLISHPDICARAAVVNVLYCTSQRQSRAPKPFEAVLGVEDGLNWETFTDCSVMYSVKSADLFNQRGHVSLERRRIIRAKLRELFLLNASD
jgi:mRNA-degrading endonuclease toxin of MazEF toxin-antitoxin module